MAPMADERTEELRRLRERAYGPDADIGSDPLALARLRSLENAARPPEPRVPSDEPPTDPGQPLPPSDPAPAAPAAERSVDADAPPLRTWWRRHAWAAPLAAALVTACAAVPTTVAVLTPGRTPTLILEQDLTGPWPEADFGRRPEGALLFDDALGVTVITQPRGWGLGNETQVCLLISYASLFTGGCASEPFLPTAALAVNDDLPPQLRDRFAGVDALQFVLDDGRVLIYAARR